MEHSTTDNRSYNCLAQNVIYFIQCTKGPSGNYVDKTKQPLCPRMNSQARMIKDRNVQSPVGECLSQNNQNGFMAHWHLRVPLQTSLCSTSTNDPLPFSKVYSFTNKFSLFQLSFTWSLAISDNFSLLHRFTAFFPIFK